MNLGNYVVMKQCAIVLNGNDIIKISNLKRKYNKIINNPNMKILEECNEDELEEKYNTYKGKLLNTVDHNEDDITLYHFRNEETGETIVSIYPTLDSYIKDYNNYIRI